MDVTTTTTDTFLNLADALQFAGETVNTPSMSKKRANGSYDEGASFVVTIYGAMRQSLDPEIDIEPYYSVTVENTEFSR